MTSNKQKRAALKARKAQRVEAERLAARRDLAQRRADGIAAGLKRGELPVNPAKLAPSGSYDDPDFVKRGTYRPRPFVCAGCGAAEVWTPRQQKWWYEIALGDRFSGPKFCRACRARERTRKAEARRIHLEGLARKTATKNAPDEPG